MVSKIMEYLQTLNSYSNLLIAIFTLAALCLAYYELRSNRISLRWHMLPSFFPKISTSSKSSVLTLENLSNNPAYDVDVWIVGHYYQEEVPYKSLLSDEFKSEVKISFSDGLYPYESEHYGIIDRVSHATFPPNSRCEIDLEFKSQPQGVDMVMQFRDSGGNNYLYQCWLFPNSNNKIRRKDLKPGYVVFDLRPVKRIEYQYPYPVRFVGWRYFFNIFKHTEHIFLPVRFLRLIPFLCESILNVFRAKMYLEKDIKDTFFRSFPSGYQSCEKSSELEGRGTFTRL